MASVIALATGASVATFVGRFMRRKKTKVETAAIAVDAAGDVVTMIQGELGRMHTTVERLEVEVEECRRDRADLRRRLDEGFRRMNIEL